ncbi:MAG: LAGLIDADG family homing endonuclease [bacterium]|nr:LAGLIDADG family homing endonuclease [bacterium]
MAYVLGFFAADGSMLKNSRGAHFIEFTITDREVLEYIQLVTESTHTIAKRERGGNCKTAYRLQIGSKEWFEDLSRLGFMQNKSKKLPLPNIPKKYFGDFVRGYFDGDGCVYFSSLQYADRKKPRRVLLTLFTSGCRLFLESLWNELRIRGVRGGSLKKKTRGFELVFSHSDSVALHHIMYHTAEVAGFCLKRKREKLEDAIRVLGLKNNAAVAQR